MIEQFGIDPARQASYIREYLDGHVRACLEAEENGGRTFPDFIGALVMDDLDGCAELSERYRAMRREEDEVRAARAEEEEKTFCEERNGIAGQALADAVRIIREGGDLKNGKITLYRSKCDTRFCSIVLHLMRRYGIDIPLRTKRWINEKLASVTVKDGHCDSLRYWRSRRGRGSEASYAYMNRLIMAVAEEAQRLPSI